MIEVRSSVSRDTPWSTEGKRDQTYTGSISLEGDVDYTEKSENLGDHGWPDQARRHRDGPCFRVFVFLFGANEIQAAVQVLHGDGLPLPIDHRIYPPIM